MASELAIDFNPLHTLGFIVTDWVEAHCLVPGGVMEGQPLVFNGWQLFCTANHYRIRPGVEHDPMRIVAPFYYRRSVIVGPQKCGKSPWGAGMMLAEAVGPTLFDGWARGGEVYRCEDHGCGCGWVYEYEPGEAMGRPRTKALIGMVATAEDQTDNIYLPLQSMILSGPLNEFLKAQDGVIRLPRKGVITPLTAASKSKLGMPLNSAIADESGLYTKQNKVLDTWQTIRRGVAGMQGRTIELTNPWDPMENSAAQQAFESRQADIFRYYNKPPVDLDYKKKRDRIKVHDYVYADSPWVDPRGIDAEAEELLETDPTQAERFFGNRLVQGLGSFLTEPVWEEGYAEWPGEDEICIGMDGSRSGDWTAIRAETRSGYRFTPEYGPDSRPTIWNPAEWDGRIPREEVLAAVDQIFRDYKVARFYVDPRHWETQTDDWALDHGEDVVFPWPTNAIGRMFGALDRYVTDLTNGTTTHDYCTDAKTHALNARKVAKPADRYVLGKPSVHQKIDVLMADVLAHEAAADMRATGRWDLQSTYFRLPR